MQREREHRARQKFLGYAAAERPGPGAGGSALDNLVCESGRSTPSPIPPPTTRVERQQEATVLREWPKTAI